MSPRQLIISGLACVVLGLVIGMAVHIWLVDRK